MHVCTLKNVFFDFSNKFPKIRELKAEWVIYRKKNDVRLRDYPIDRHDTQNEAPNTILAANRLRSVIPQFILMKV